MTPPARPPDFQTLLHRANDAGRMAALFETPVADDDYLHWDELRRRKPPQGLALDEWWLALKLRRRMQYRPLPCADAGGTPFRYALADAVLAGVHAVDKGGGTAIGALDAAIDPALRDRYIFTSLAQEAITSSLLEGAVATREAAKELIRTSRRPRDKSEWMILNNFRAMQHIMKIADRPLTPEGVFEIHRILTANTLDNPDAAGRLRNAAEPVHVVDGEGTVYHEPPAAPELPVRLDALCAFANGGTGAGGVFIPPVLRAIVLHFWLAYDHPFVDGNGRTARALFYWAMLRQGFWPFEFISISGILHKAPAQYARSLLLTETDGNDLTYFILHQLDVIGRAIRELYAYIERKRLEIKDAENRLRNFPELNHRQLALVSHALRHPGKELALKHYQEQYRIAYATARADLMSLVQLGMYEQVKRGKTLFFIPSAQLERRLKER
jgi:Fic family protein